MKRVWLSWSSGKDSAHTLLYLSLNKHFKVRGLFTTYNQNESRINLHGTRLEVLQAQARALKLPLKAVSLPTPCPNIVYEDKMKDIILAARKDNIDTFAFGDLFLEDIRKYREEKMKGQGLELTFPLWLRPTKDLAIEMIETGLKAKICAIDKSKLNESFLGREFDRDFLSDLPPEVDACGENGEFHTLVYNMKLFSAPLSLKSGEVVQDGQFASLDFKLIT